MMQYKENPSDRNEYAPGVIKRISWGAIFAAAFVAIAIQLTLAFLGMAIGFNTINPATEQNPFGGLGIGTAIWWAVTFIISLFIGGWIAGRLSGIPSRLSGALHGLVAWSLATIVTFFLVTSTIGTVIGGAFGVVKSVAGGAAQAAATGIGASLGNAQGADQDINQQISQIIAGVQDSTTRNEVSQAMDPIINNPDAVTPQQHQRAVDVLVNNTDMTPAEANRTVDNLIATSQKVHQGGAQAEATARQYGQEAANALSLASLFAFIFMILGGIAAAIGGAVGVPFDRGSRLFYVEEPKIEQPSRPQPERREPVSTR